MVKFAARVPKIAPFEVMQVLARAQALAAQGRDVIHMEVGEPDFDTAEVVVRAGQRALAAGLTRYTPALGLPELRQAIADYYGRYHHVDVAPERVVVTPGATGGLALLAALLLDPGDQLLLSDPGYPCYRNFVHLVNAHPTLLPTYAEQHYQMDAAQLFAAAPRVAGVLLASPANPTGAMLRKEALAEAIAVMHAHDRFVIVDEIYQGLTYPLDGAPRPQSHGVVGISDTVSTALQLSDDVFVVNSFSKYFGMTGWRLGWIVAPERAVPHLERLAQNFVISASTPAQHAAIAALSEPAIAVHESRRETFWQRREFLLAGLRTLGFGVSKPEGAFYLYADIRHTGMSGAEFCIALLENYGVAATPGTDFGQYRARDHVRFTYTTDIARLQTALQRMDEFLREPRSAAVN